MYICQSQSPNSSIYLYCQWYFCAQKYHKGSRGTLDQIWIDSIAMCPQSPTRGPAPADKQAFGLDFGPTSLGIIAL